MKTFFFSIFVMLFLLTSAHAEFKQTPLPYSFDALEPYIDARTLELHYTKHHASAVASLNTALKESGKENINDLTQIFKDISNFNISIRNNAGSHYAHSFFWTILTPNKNTIPSEKLKTALQNSFGSIDEFKNKFNKEALSRYGSGWTWLIVNSEKKLLITSTPNADNPLMADAPIKGIPILTVDVWEHAYYLKYQNKRADFLQAIWNIINWNEVSNLYEKALKL